MGRKQGEGLGFVVQLCGNGTSQCQTVKSGGAPANFIHQHQRVGCGGMQYLRGFQHFQHKGGLRIGQVVCRANAGVNGVNRTNPASRRRHVAAHRGQQYHQSHLTHVSRFAAHIGSGDDLHALLGRQARVVGYKAARLPACALTTGLVQARLNHGVTALFNLNAGMAHKLWFRPVER